MPIHAVLTGDITNSTKLKPVIEKKLLKDLYEILATFKFEFYRGDSFQAYINNPEESLRVALLCRAAAISKTDANDQIPVDIRISIGIGTIATPLRTLGSAKGEAFVLSGRTFDEMHKNASKLSIRTNHKIINTGLQILTEYTNAIFKEITSKQAEVVFLLLQKETQQLAAEKLQKSKSTISQIARAARWSELESILKNFEDLINQLK
jgi:hypothetical protein